MKSRLSLGFAAAAMAILVSTSVLTGCGKTTTALSPPTGRASEDVSYALKTLETRQEAIRGVYYDRSLIERLPNVLFSIDGEDAAALDAGVVIGEVLEVTPGRGYVADEADASGTEAPFDANDAKWRTITVTMSVTQKWGYTGGDRASFGLSFGGEIDQERMMRGVREMGRVIVALRPSGSYRYDRSLYRVARNASLIGQVDADGKFTFPVLGDYEERYVDGAGSSADLDRAAQAPVRTIEIKDGDRVR